MPYKLRLSALATGSIWLIVMLAAVIATWRPLWWHVDFFQQAGPAFHQLILVLLPVLMIAPLVYIRVRQTGLWRHELKVYLALAILPLLIYEPRGLVVAILLFASSFSIGYWTLKFFSLEPEEAVEEIVLSTATGLGIITLVLFGLGMTGLFKTWAFAILLAPCVMGWRQLLEDIQEILADATQAEELRSPLTGIAAFFGAAFILITALSALTATTNGDAIRFHLALAKSYLQSGSLTVPPFIEYGYYPQGFEVLTAMLWGVGGLVAAQMLPAMLFLLCLMLVYRIGRQCALNRSSAFVGAVIGGSIPFVHWTGSVVKNDIGLVLFQLAALCAVLQWSRTKKFRWVQLSVVLVGFSFGVKHTALFGAVAMAPILFVAARREANRLKAFASLALLFVLVGTCWVGRTWIIKGDPTYPEVTNRAVSHGGYEAQESKRITRYGEILYQTHFLSRGHFESPSNNAMGIFLLVFFPLWFTIKLVEKNETLRYVWWFTGIYLLYWGTILSTLRYAMTPILLVMLLLAARMEAFEGTAKKAGVWLVRIAVVYCFIFALLVTVIQEMVPQLPSLLTFKMQQTDFLREFLPPFAAAEQLIKFSRPEDKVLSIGDWAVAYTPYPAQVKHLYRTDRNYTPQDIDTELPKLPYRYLILPSGPALPALEEAAKRHRGLAEVYAGANFHLYLLN